MSDEASTVHYDERARPIEDADTFQLVFNFHDGSQEVIGFSRSTSVLDELDKTITAPTWELSRLGLL